MSKNCSFLFIYRRCAATKEPLSGSGSLHSYVSSSTPPTSRPTTPSRPQTEHRTVPLSTLPSLGWPKAASAMNSGYTVCFWSWFPGWPSLSSTCWSFPALSGPTGACPNGRASKDRRRRRRRRTRWRASFWPWPSCSWSWSLYSASPNASSWCNQRSWVLYLYS